MKRYITFIIICLSLFVLGSVSLLKCGEQNSADSERWDLRIIKEAPIWKYLLVNYFYADRTIYWPERKEALKKVIEEFPDSRWADDAALLLAGGQASIEDDIKGAIIVLKKIIQDYPSENTIVTGWDLEKGCRINEAWLMWAPDLAFLDQDRTIRASYPFDRDGMISILEREALTYFDHIEKFPVPTKNVAQLGIASMLQALGDLSGASSELEDLISGYSDLPAINSADREAANNPDGYLIACEPPSDMTPVWRIQYAAYQSLISLYQLQDKKDKAEKLALELVSICSPDGWYWNINRYVGDIHAANGQWSMAAMQYDLALQGLQKLVAKQAQRQEALYQAGYVMKPGDFISWKDQALKFQEANIVKLEELLKEMRFH